jgi:hypothetical protein
VAGRESPDVSVGVRSAQGCPRGEVAHSGLRSGPWTSRECQRRMVRMDP